MGRVISVHSSRGGTGKTLIAVNLAAILARKGRNVCLFDMDFRAPSLSTVFKVGDYRLIKYWVNDFLNGDCSIDKAMIDLTSRYGTKGKFLVGLANPSTEAIREMMTKDRIWEREALRRLLRLKSILLNNMEIDYAIYDTSPGVQYSALNAVVGSDICIMVATLDALDMEGTRSVIKELYDAFEKETIILMNKVPAEFLSPEKKREELSRQLKSTFAQPLIEVMPCYCDVLRSSRVSIFAFEKPEHPFTKALHEVADKLEHSEDS